MVQRKKIFTSDHKKHLNIQDNSQQKQPYVLDQEGKILENETPMLLEEESPGVQCQPQSYMQWKSPKNNTFNIPITWKRQRQQHAASRLDKREANTMTSPTNGQEIVGIKGIMAQQTNLNSLPKNRKNIVSNISQHQKQNGSGPFSTNVSSKQLSNRNSKELVPKKQQVKTTKNDLKITDQSQLDRSPDKLVQENSNNQTNLTDKLNSLLKATDPTDIVSDDILDQKLEPGMQQTSFDTEVNDKSFLVQLGVMQDVGNEGKTQGYQKPTVSSKIKASAVANLKLQIQQRSCETQELNDQQQTLSNGEADNQKQDQSVWSGGDRHSTLKDKSAVSQKSMPSKLKIMSGNIENNTENSKENELSPVPHMSPQLSPHFLLSRRDSKKSMLDGLLLEKHVQQMTQTQETESVPDTHSKRNSTTTQVYSTLSKRNEKKVEEAKSSRTSRNRPFRDIEQILKIQTQTQWINRSPSSHSSRNQLSQTQQMKITSSSSQKDNKISRFLRNRHQSVKPPNQQETIKLKSIFDNQRKTIMQTKQNEMEVGGRNIATILNSPVSSNNTLVANPAVKQISVKNNTLGHTFNLGSNLQINQQANDIFLQQHSSHLRSTNLQFQNIHQQPAQSTNISLNQISKVMPSVQLNTSNQISTNQMLGRPSTHHNETTKTFQMPMGSIFLTPDINRTSNIGPGEFKGNDNQGYFPANMMIDEGISGSRISDQPPQGSYNINTQNDQYLERLSQQADQNSKENSKIKHQNNLSGVLINGSGVNFDNQGRMMKGQLNSKKYNTSFNITGLTDQDQQMVSIDIIASNAAQAPNQREVKRGKSHSIMDVNVTKAKDGKSSALDNLSKKSNQPSQQFSIDNIQSNQNETGRPGPNNESPEETSAHKMSPKNFQAQKDQGNQQDSTKTSKPMLIHIKSTPNVQESELNLKENITNMASVLQNIENLNIQGLYGNKADQKQSKPLLTKKQTKVSLQSMRIEPATNSQTNPDQVWVPQANLYQINQNKSSKIYKTKNLTQVDGQIYKIDNPDEPNTFYISQPTPKPQQHKPIFNASTKVNCKETLKNDMSKYYSLNKTHFESKSCTNNLQVNANKEGGHSRAVPTFRCEGKLCPSKIQNMTIRKHLVQVEKAFIDDKIPLRIPYNILQAGDIKGFRDAVLGVDGQKQIVLGDNHYYILALAYQQQSLFLQQMRDFKQMQQNYKNQAQSDNLDQIQDGIQDFIQFQKILRACSPPSIDGKDNFSDEIQTDGDFKRSLTKKDIQNIKIFIQNEISGKNQDLGLTPQQTLKLESMLTMKGDDNPSKLRDWVRGQTQYFDDKLNIDEIIDQSPGRSKRGQYLNTQTGPESPNQLQTFDKQEEIEQKTTQEIEQQNVFSQIQPTFNFDIFKTENINSENLQEFTDQKNIDASNCTTKMTKYFRKQTADLENINNRPQNNLEDDLQAQSFTQVDNHHLESITSRGNNKSFKEMRDFNNEAQNFTTMSPPQDLVSKNSSPQQNMMFIEKPRVNITSPTSPKRVDVSPVQHQYPNDSLSPLSSNGPGNSANITKRDARIHEMSPVSQWQDTNIALNSPILSGDTPNENLDDYMMNYNVDEETLKNYLKTSNKRVDHLKLLAEFYNVDQQSKQSNQNIKIQQDQNEKGPSEVVSVTNIKQPENAGKRPKSTKQKQYENILKTHKAVPQRHFNFQYVLDEEQMLKDFVQNQVKERVQTKSFSPVNREAKNYDLSKFVVQKRDQNKQMKRNDSAITPTSFKSGVSPMLPGYYQTNSNSEERSSVVDKPNSPQKMTFLFKNDLIHSSAVSIKDSFLQNQQSAHPQKWPKAHIDRVLQIMEKRQTIQSPTRSNQRTTSPQHFENPFFQARLQQKKQKDLNLSMMGVIGKKCPKMHQYYQGLYESQMCLEQGQENEIKSALAKYASGAEMTSKEKAGVSENEDIKSLKSPKSIKAVMKKNQRLQVQKRKSDVVESDENPKQVCIQCFVLYHLIFQKHLDLQQ